MISQNGHNLNCLQQKRIRHTCSCHTNAMYMHLHGFKKYSHSPIPSGKKIRKLIPTIRILVWGLVAILLFHNDILKIRCYVTLPNKVHYFAFLRPYYCLIKNHMISNSIDHVTISHHKIVFLLSDMNFSLITDYKHHWIIQSNIGLF